MVVKKKWTHDDIPDQTGKLVIVTGANSGLGFEATKSLASKNASVIMACRNLDKANEAKQQIVDDYPEAILDVIQLDLADLSSIKAFNKTFRKKYDTIDLLLNNAGIMLVPTRVETKDGFEYQFGINHLGHFALTALVFDLIDTVQGRIVTMSSNAHKFGDMDFDDLNWEKNYSSSAAYGRSKLANLYFTYELARKLDNDESNILAVAAHPGWSNTNLQSTGLSTGKTGIKSKLLRFGAAIGNVLIGQSAERGVLPFLYAATAKDVENGDYYGPGGIQEMRGYPRKVESTELSHDEEKAKKLWKVSEELTGIEFNIN